MFRFSLALILLTGTTLFSFQGPPTSDYSLSVNVGLVQLPVFVLDRKDNPVRGLRPEHFSVYEDKVRQDISLFKQEDVPLSVGLVIDASGSMRDKQERLNAAALTFVQESNPEDETFIVSFGDTATLEQDFTRSTRALSRSLRDITPDGNTALYDAVLLAARHLETGSHEKKVLLVISDGEDNKSQYKLGEVLENIRESSINLYTVGLRSNENLLSTGIFASKGRKALKEFAEVTGGRSFFPNSPDDVHEVCRRIAHDLRNQYTIGYRPSNENLDGSWRKLTVQINPPKGTSKLKVRSKKGYYAPSAPNGLSTLRPAKLK